MAQKKTEISRRQFFVNGAVAVSALSAVGLGVNYIKNKNKQSGKFLLRPPGAIEEESFLFACIKCGLCVQICPIEAVKLATIADNLSYGTPYIDVREQACDFSCDSLQCAETCPTAALDFLQFKDAGEKAITAHYEENPEVDPNFNPFEVQIKAMKKAVRMGIAEMDRHTCLANHGKGFKGKLKGENPNSVYRSREEGESRASKLSERHFDRELCNLCVTECPIGETAIIMEEQITRNGRKKIRPRVLEGCTGCGVCVMVCPSEPKSISIKKLQLAEK